MFDEKPDGDPHGECAAEIARLQELVRWAYGKYGECAAEIARLQELVRWAYGKLHGRTFSSMDDALKLDEMKLLRPPTPVGWSDTDWLAHLEEIRQNEAAYARGPLPERGWD